MDYNYNGAPLTACIKTWKKNIFVLYDVRVCKCHGRKMTRELEKCIRDARGE